MKEMKRQAKYHGEIGANGRAYQKGQFIAEQAEYQGRGSKAVKGNGKQMIEPYVWEVPVDAEMKSIFAFIQGVYGNCYTGEINKQAIAYYGENLAKIENLIARFQNGERWFYPNQEIYL